MARKVGRIFTEHGSRMVGVDVLNSDKFVNNYSLAHLQDLVKLADELEKPIMYVKEKEQEAINTFYVADQDNLYTFKLEMPSEEEATVLTKEEKKTLKLQQKEEKKLQKEEAKLAKKAKKAGNQDEIAATMEIEE